MEYIEIDLPESGWTKYTPSSPGKILSISKFRRSFNFFSPQLENQSITIRFDNTKGYWSNFLRSDDRFVKGKKLKYYNNNILRGTFYISDFPEPNSMSEFIIKADLFQNLDSQISKRITKDDFPEMPDENDGKWGNIVGGTFTDENWKNKGQLTAYLVSPGKYHAAWHHMWNISGVWDKDGNSKVFTKDNNPDENCYIEISGLEDLEVYFNGSGLMDSQGYFIENAGEILLRVSVLFGSIGIDLSQELIQELDRFTDISILITDQTWKSHLVEFSLNFGTIFYLDSEGNILGTYIDFNNINPDKTLTLGGVDKYIEFPVIGEILQSISRKYQYHFRDKEYLFIPVTKMSTQWTADEIEREYKYQTNALATHDVAISELWLKKDQIWRISFEILEKTADIDLTSKILIKHPLGNRTICVNSIEPIETGKLKISGIDLNPLYISQFLLLDESDPDVAILTEETDPDCLLLM